LTCWDVVAPANGTYTFRGELYDLAQIDPVLANDSSTITIVVDEQQGEAPAGAAARAAEAAPRPHPPEQ
jgi:hypothetical protein